MMPNKIWIMTEADYQQFQKYKLEKYHASGIKGDINDSVLTKYYTHFIVHFFRKLKVSKEEPFKTQKMIHVAVCLFKRFYLLNEYGDNLYAQNVLCCIYLSLKINQVPNEEIAHYARAWKNKDKIFLNEDCLHFKDPGYSEKEIYLMRGIGFQIGRSPIIPSVQSLFHLIKKNITDQNLIRQILDQIKQMLRRVYTDMKALFFFQGPKLGLTILLHVLKVKQICQKLDLTVQEIFDHNLDELLQTKKQQMAKVLKYVQQIEKFDHKEAGNAVKQLRDRLITAKKKVFQVPQRKSPKIVPLSYSFQQLNQ